MWELELKINNLDVLKKFTKKAGMWSHFQLEYFISRKFLSHLLSVYILTYTVTYQLLEYIKRFKGPVKLSKKTCLN